MSRKKKARHQEARLYHADNPIMNHRAVSAAIHGQVRGFGLHGRRSISLIVLGTVGVSHSRFCRTEIAMLGLLPKSIQVPQYRKDFQLVESILVFPRKVNGIREITFAGFVEATD